MTTKTIIFGLVGSGKSTLYRKLNEEKTANAVEIELPQICSNNDYLKERLFELFLYDNDIDVIITHPYFLCKNFQKIIKDSKISVTYKFLELSFDERCERISNRSKGINSNCCIFSLEYLQQEEKSLKSLKEALI